MWIYCVHYNIANVQCIDYRCIVLAYSVINIHCTLCTVYNLQCTLYSV